MKTQIIKNKTQILNNQYLTDQAMLVEFLLKNTKGKVFAKKNDKRLGITA